MSQEIAQAVRDAIEHRGRPVTLKIAAAETEIRAVITHNAQIFDDTGQASRATVLRAMDADISGLKKGAMFYEHDSSTWYQYLTVLESDRITTLVKLGKCNAPT